MIDFKQFNHISIIDIQIGEYRGFIDKEDSSSIIWSRTEIWIIWTQWILGLKWWWLPFWGRHRTNEACQTCQNRWQTFRSTWEQQMWRFHRDDVDQMLFRHVCFTWRLWSYWFIHKVIDFNWSAYSSHPLSYMWRPPSFIHHILVKSISWIIWVVRTSWNQWTINNIVVIG